MSIKIISKESNIRQKLASATASPLKAYQTLTFGKQSVSAFLIYEFLTSVLGPFPGGLGFYLRKLFYPRLFKHFGRGVIIGRNVVLRHPHHISLGNNVTVDDNCLLDGRGAGLAGLVLEDNTLVNRNCMLVAKAGPIRLGRRTSLGSNSSIVSMDGVQIGEAVLIAGECCLSAGAYRFDSPEIPIMDQETYTRGPIRIGAGAWLGTRVTVLDGVSIGDGAVVGACSLVNKDLSAGAIAAGVPAKVIRMAG